MRVVDEGTVSLPQGRVTFLFTDIEGSTALLRKLADRYAEVLAEHRRVLREAVERYGGAVFGTEGDAVFSVFTDPAAAVAAAAQAQSVLGALPVRVRMGLHTGEAALRDGDYVGLDIHRVARIAATGHGGQIVLSRATREAAGDGTTFRDLGEHRLKDLPEAEWLFQLGEEEFPPLRSLSNTNLPVPPTPLVGRRREVDELRALFRAGKTRMVTITGPGGTGKTRLAVAVAGELSDSFPNGVVYVPLDPVTDAAIVVPEIARALGVAEQAGDPLEAVLVRRLEERTLLLVLDNVEQVIPAAPAVAELLQATAGLHVLATSREPLRIRGESEYALPPLESDEALDLFVERARAVRADFSLDDEEPIARDICERLDRLPLAIELAAARTKLLSLPALSERLDRRLAVVASTRRDLPERHRTLRGAIEWSYDLLQPDERTLFARLAVFAGGWALEAAEAVCEADLDTLASLLDKSLVTRDENNRFAMLMTIREYGLDRLGECGDAEAVRRAHAEYYLGVVRATESELGGPAQVEVLELLEREHDNFRAALAWSLGADRALAVQLAGALGPFWYRHTHVLEGVAWLERALEGDDGGDPAARARVVHHLGVLNDLRRDHQTARRWLEEAVALYRRTDDVPRLTRSMNSLGVVLRNAGDGRRARELLAECLAMRRDLGDELLISVTTCNLGIVAFDEGDLDGAQVLFEESLAIDRRLGDNGGIATNVVNLGWVALARGQLKLAAELAVKALRGFLEVGDREGLAEALEQAAALAFRLGDAQQGARLAGTAKELREVIGVPWGYGSERIEREIEAIRSDLGERSFEAAYEVGRRLDAEQEAREALARLEGHASDLA